MGRGQRIRDFKQWPKEKPLTSTGKIVFYDPDSDDEYGLTPDQVGTASPGGLQALVARIAALENGQVIPGPEAPTVATLDQTSLTGRFQLPSGTILDQLEIDVTPAVS